MNKVNKTGNFPLVKAAAAVVIVVPVLYLGLGFLGIAGVKFFIPQYADVSLSIANNDLVISGESGDLGACTPPRQIGCVRVRSNKTANIRFKLQNAEDWTFSRMQLVAAPAAKLGFGQQTGFIQAMADDFYVKINGTKVHPDNDGIINLNGLKKGEAFRLVDRNRYPPKGNPPQIYTYQIEACNGQCLQTDPKIENEGDN